MLANEMLEKRVAQQDQELEVVQNYISDLIETDIAPKQSFDQSYLEKQE